MIILCGSRGKDGYVPAVRMEFKYLDRSVVIELCKLREITAVFTGTMVTKTNCGDQPACIIHITTNLTITKIRYGGKKKNAARWLQEENGCVGCECKVQILSRKPTRTKNESKGIVTRNEASK